MFSFLMRLLGVLLIAGAVIAAAIDGTKSIAASKLVMTPLGLQWFEFSPDTLNAAQAGIQRNVSPWLWDPVIQNLLLLPTWLVAGLLGALFVWIGSHRRRRRRMRLARGL